MDVAKTYPLGIKDGVLERPRFSSMIFPAINIIYRWFPSCNPSFNQGDFPAMAVDSPGGYPDSSHVQTRLLISNLPRKTSWCKAPHDRLLCQVLDYGTTCWLDLVLQFKGQHTETCARHASIPVSPASCCQNSLRKNRWKSTKKNYFEWISPRENHRNHSTNAENQKKNSGKIALPKS